MAAVPGPETGLFEGLGLVDPGVRLVRHRRPDGTQPFSDSEVAMYGGLVRKS